MVMIEISFEKINRVGWSILGFLLSSLMFLELIVGGEIFALLAGLVLIFGFPFMLFILICRGLVLFKERYPVTPSQRVTNSKIRGKGGEKREWKNE